MKKFNLSKKSIALLAAALVLFTSGGFLATKATPAILSNQHITQFTLDELKVALKENGSTVDKQLKLDNFDKDSEGKLLIKPGKLIKEELSAENTTGYDEYVRMVIRKYWVDAEGQKTTDLDPAMIELTYNTDSWAKNESECTPEMEVWYYKSILGGNQTTPPAVTKVRIADGVIDQIVEDEPVKEGDKTIYTYHYKYNGYSFVLQAEAQAVQTHNKDEAIKSVWGIEASKTPIG